MKIKKELIKRDIAGDTVLVPCGKTVSESTGLFMLNELGGFLWDRLEGAETADDLLKAVLEEYEVSEAEARQDIAEFLDKLKSMGII